MSSDFKKGTCCAGSLCQNPDQQLRPVHKCHKCNGVVHYLCSFVSYNNGVNVHTCNLCLEKDTSRQSVDNLNVRNGLNHETEVQHDTGISLATANGSNDGTEVIGGRVPGQSLERGDSDASLGRRHQTGGNIATEAIVGGNDNEGSVSVRSVSGIGRNSLRADDCLVSAHINSRHRNTSSTLRVRNRNTGGEQPVLLENLQLNEAHLVAMKETESNSKKAKTKRDYCNRLNTIINWVKENYMDYYSEGVIPLSDEQKENKAEYHKSTEDF